MCNPCLDHLCYLCLGTAQEPRPTKVLYRHPKKMPARLSPCGRSARPTLSLLAVTLLHGYVMSPVLVPDLHQRLATTTFAGSRFGKILG